MGYAIIVITHQQPPAEFCSLNTVSIKTNITSKPKNAIFAAES
jgi:hypothetical protein